MSESDSYGSDLPRWKTGGSYQCAICAKSIDHGSAMIEFLVCLGRTRHTRVWACAEHIIGDGILSHPVIVDGLRASGMSRKVDAARKASSRDGIRASRFSTPSTKDNVSSDEDHGFIPDSSPRGKATEPDSESFVPANTVSTRLGVTKEAVRLLVEKMNVEIIVNNGVPSVKVEDLNRMADDIRSRYAKVSKSVSAEKYKDQVSREELDQDGM